MGYNRRSAASAIVSINLSYVQCSTHVGAGGAETRVRVNPSWGYPSLDMKCKKLVIYNSQSEIFAAPSWDYSTRSSHFEFSLHNILPPPTHITHQHIQRTHANDHDKTTSQNNDHDKTTSVGTTSNKPPSQPIQQL